MKIKSAKPEYLEQAKQLSADETERLLSRISDKLFKRLKAEELSIQEIAGIQLEIEDTQLGEWREKMAEIRSREDKKKEEKKNKD